MVNHYSHETIENHHRQGVEKEKKEKKRKKEEEDVEAVVMKTLI